MAKKTTKDRIDFTKLVVGQRLKITSTENNNRDTCKVGDIVDFIKQYPSNDEYIVAKDSKGAQVNIHKDTVVLHSVERTFVIERIADLTAELDKEKAKLAYLDEMGLDEFDELEYRAYTALTIAEDTKRPKKERARALADLIRDNV